MNQRWRIGSIFGIPLFVDASWFVVVALLTWVDGSDWQQMYPAWGTGWAWGAGFAMALLLFGSVLLHELGHSLVAKAQGIQVNSITLFLFGGVAAIEQESKTPGQAFQVAIAGPLVSLGLFLLLSLATLILPGNTPAAVLAANLARLNLVLALFNLLPGLPLDGGQILKAAIWKATGNRFRGVHWAAKTGQVLGWIALSLGLGVVLFFGATNGLWLALLGWFGIRNATLYDRFTNLQEALAALKASDAISNDFRVVDAEMTLREFADRYLLAETRPSSYFAASEGRYRGLVQAEELSNVERSLWESQTVQTLVRPLTEIATVQQTAPLTEVILLLENQNLPRVTVLSPAGAVAGVIDRGDTVRALVKALNLPVSEADIRQIKEAGSYPASFQLPAIAQSVLRDAAPAVTPAPVTPEVTTN
ncbi:MAG: site-2 protease family protein [Aphanocapsa sp. GSE-SYN-MK-11-07L]|jgi:Zn-dependent protease/CBS domain-containing protein|nr:site-2 protease family protein [Aphanocapsa sp. GSE-SYN-MK-11-07L]